MHHIHGDSINQLEDANWLNLLDSTFSTTYFSQGRGVIFGTTMYRAPDKHSPDTQRLCDDLHALISRIRMPLRT